MKITNIRLKHTTQNGKKIVIQDAENTSAVESLLEYADACSITSNYELVSFAIDINSLDMYTEHEVEGNVRFFVQNNIMKYDIMTTKSYHEIYSDMINNAIGICFRFVSQICIEYCKVMMNEINAYLKGAYSPCYTEFGYTTYYVIGDHYDYSWLQNHDISIPEDEIDNDPV